MQFAKSKSLKKKSLKNINNKSTGYITMFEFDLAHFTEKQGAGKKYCN